MARASIYTGLLKAILEETGEPVSEGDILVVNGSGEVVALDPTELSLLTSYLQVGGDGDAANKVSGDLSATRLMLGADVAFGEPSATGPFGIAAGKFVHLSGEVTDLLSGSVNSINGVVKVNPASNSLAEFRALNFCLVLQPPTGVTLATAEAGFFEVRHRNDGAIGTEVDGVVIRPYVLDSLSPAIVGTPAVVRGLYIRRFQRPSGSSSGAITAFRGIEFSTDGGSFISGLTGLVDILIQNPAANTVITDHIGIDIRQLTRATRSIGIKNASPYQAAPSTVQTLLAATAILVNAESVQITGTGAITSTAAPTIADGVDGMRVRIMYVGSGTYVLSDRGTLANSNLRLSANTITLGPGDSIDLQFSLTLGDWIQVGQTNVL